MHQRNSILWSLFYVPTNAKGLNDLTNIGICLGFKNLLAVNQTIVFHINIVHLFNVLVC